MLTLLIMWTLSWVGYSNASSVQGFMESGKTDLFELSILHFNDFHARFQEISNNAGTCQHGNGHECIGGLPRVLTASRQLLKERPNAIFLNAGDHYQGTLWYNIHRWNVTVEFMNKLPHDAMTIGNHEFDDKIAGLVPFLKSIQAPIVVTNIDASNEPDMQGLTKNSTIIERGGRRIGIIGVILQSTPEIANTEKLIFLDEIETVNLEAEKLVKDEKVDIVIVLSHCGLDVDRIMATNCPLIDVIVGGHSHTFLYSGTPPFVDYPIDGYPVVVEQQKTGRKVLIVQAAAFTKYLGNLTVWFDENGEVENWDGNPIILDDTYEQDPVMLAELASWKIEVDEIGKEIVGQSKVHLINQCRRQECNIGNMITDAMVDAYINEAEDSSYWTFAALGIINSGGIRGSVDLGMITYADLITIQPFENYWDVVEMQGKDIRKTLEVSVAMDFRKADWPGKTFLIWSGIKVIYDIRRVPYSRVVDVKVRCRKCRIPKYENLENEEWYRIVMPNFLVNGGDGHTIIAKNHRNHVPGIKDIDQLLPYVKRISPLTNEIEGRMIFINEQV